MSCICLLFPVIAIGIVIGVAISCIIFIIAVLIYRYRLKYRFAKPFYMNCVIILDNFCSLMTLLLAAY